MNYYMCELLAISSEKPLKTNKYLKTFYNHSKHHPHGWGLAIKDKNKYIIDKEPQKANNSIKLKEILEKDIITDNLIAHIRLATLGNMIKENCHPFSKKDNLGRTWLLMHNGTIFDGEELEKYKKVQEGQSDSERILLYIVDQINHTKFHSSTELIQLLDELITNLAKNNKLNIMLICNDLIIVHANYKNSLYYLEKSNSLLVSTKELSGENWQLLEINRVIGLRKGKKIYEGQKHDYEYKITRENFHFIINSMTPELRDKIKEDFGDLNYLEEYIISE